MLLRLRRGNDTMLNPPANTDVITLSGGGTAGLYDNAVNSCSYHIQMPDQAIARRSNFGIDGETITNVDFKNVVESCEVIIKDTTVGFGNSAGLFNLIQEFFFEAEKASETGYGEDVYVEFTTDNAPVATTDYPRAKLLRGRVELSDRIKTRFMSDGTGIVNLIWEREPSFERFDEVEALLGNDITASTTGGVTLTNTSETISTIRNWVDVLPNGVDSEVPCSIRLDIENTNVAAVSMQRFFVGYNDWSDLSSGTAQALIIEGETANEVAAPPGGTGTYTSVVDVSSSEDAYLDRQYTFVGTLDEVNLGTYDITSAVLANLKGNTFRVFGLFKALPPTNGFEVRIKLLSSLTGELITTMPWVILDDGRYVQDLGVVTLPPTLAKTTPLHPIRIFFEMRHDVAGAQTLLLDYFSLLPLNQWRFYLPSSNDGITKTYFLVDDQNFSDSVYGREAGTSNRFPLHVPVNAPMLFPIRASGNNRFYFMIDLLSGQQTLPTNQFDVQIFYKPRFLLPR